MNGNKAFCVVSDALGKADPQKASSAPSGVLNNGKTITKVKNNMHKMI